MDRPLSVHPNSVSALRAIFAVHFPTAKYVLDSTYGNGTFWHWPTGFAVIGGDIDPSRARDYVGDCRVLPFADDSMDVVVIDPPFMGGGHSGIIKTRYGRVGERHSVRDLPPLYMDAMREGWRVARQGVVIKCQDAVESGEYHMIHFDIIANALCLGMGRPVDTAIIARTFALTDPRWHTVQHLRSAHSYFFVWKK